MSSLSHPPVLTIIGPTASGKTELAFRIARLCGGEIISADSRQIYRGMDIGTAKPPRDMLEALRHHFIDEKEIGQSFSSGDFAAEARARISKLRALGIPAIVAGGSTLYLEGLLKGFADLPQSDPEIRARLLRELEASGKERLFRRLERLDPEQARTLDPTKTHRLIRSLEIIEISGRTVTGLQQNNACPTSGIDFITIALDMPRPVLYERIDRRTEAMIREGLETETMQLHQQYRNEWHHLNLNALNTVGYREMFEHFEGNYDLDTAVCLIAQHTRNYAKRQLTFFRNRLAPEWIEAPLRDVAIQKLAEELCRRIS
jgi:tRNA dimethylallyltransferase